LQAQKDAAQEQKETITSREKTQENAIEQDAQARDRVANTQADDAHRNAAALQDQADQAKVKAPSFEAPSSRNGTSDIGYLCDAFFSLDCSKASKTNSFAWRP
jgi:hypothetical protein